MSHYFYETLGRYTWWHAKRSARRKMNAVAIRTGVISAGVIGVVAVGAVLARSHAPAE